MSLFYLTVNTFDGIPISIRFIPESESVSVTDSLEPRRSINEKLGLFRVMFSAMAAGMPILGITQPYDDEARIIDAFDAGIHVQQGGVEGVVDAVRTWKENPELVEDQRSTLGRRSSNDSRKTSQSIAITAS